MSEAVWLIKISPADFSRSRYRCLYPVESNCLQPRNSWRISKFNQYITERDRFLLEDQNYIAKGYKPILVKNEGYADVAYEETPELIEQERREAIRSVSLSICQSV